MKRWVTAVSFVFFAAIGIVVSGAEAATEGFEMGNLTSLPWVTGGNASWSAKTTKAHTGVYSAEAPVSIVDNQSSYLQVTLDCTDGNVTFWYSVSSEANYDFLRFYIDGVLQKQWSGSVPWSQASFAVKAGKHTFKWVYTKDYSISTGSDTAWIDDIVIPTVIAPPPGSLIEDFETGDLSKLPWSATGSGQWSVTGTTVHGGSYAAEAPVSIADNQSASLEVTLDCTDGTAAFWYSTSTEANHDFLLFYIDGVLYNQWSGSLSWGQSPAYRVAAGRHTFKWVYAKDYSASAGSDTVWIDDIILPSAPASGSLDTSFGTGGKTATSIGNYDTARAVIVQPDGKIVAAGFANNSTTLNDFALVRYNPNGTFDTGFGTGGKVTTDFPIGRTDTAYAAALQPDGKIVVAGSSYTGSSLSMDFAVARYNANGTLDAGFGTGGRVLTAVGSSYEEAYAVAVQADGKIIAAGYTGNGSNGNDFALVRYNANGTLDTSFGKSGKTIIDFSGGNDYIQDIVVQKDGKIVAAGHSSVELALARFNSDGTPDESFGTYGKVVMAAVSTGHGVALQSDGKIVVAGTVDRHNPDMTVNVDFALARFNVDGSIDEAFGSGGVVTTDFGSNSDYARDVVIQTDGKIVVAGEVLNIAGNTNMDFAFARFNADGSPDNGFGTGGKAIAPLSTSGDSAFCVAIQADGKLIAAGRFYADAYASPDFVVARFWP